VQPLEGEDKSLRVFMKPTDRQKVCPHCEGRIALEAKECIYCGTEQLKVAPPAYKAASLQDSLSALYTPPYPSHKTSSLEEEGDLKRKTIPSTESFLEENQKNDQAKRTFYALSLFLSAAYLLTLGCLQFFFSEGGHLQLEWNSRYWFFYCLGSLPLFYFGLKKIQSLEK
jgi:ribosomal protein L40E